MTDLAVEPVTPFSVRRLTVPSQATQAFQERYEGGTGSSPRPESAQPWQTMARSWLSVVRPLIWEDPAGHACFSVDPPKLAGSQSS